jgi:uncharacterized protein (TIRG00374 family)
MSTDDATTATDADAKPPTDAPPAAFTKKKSKTQRIVSIVIALAVIIAVFGFALPKFASYADAWAAIQKMQGWQIALLVAIALSRLALQPFQLQAALPGLRFVPAFTANAWSTAMSNTVPAGGAVAVGITYQMLMSWGSTVAEITRMLIVTGIWNNLVKLALPVTAIIALAFQDKVTAKYLDLAGLGLIALVVVIGLLVLVLRSKRAANAIGEFAGKVASWFLHFARRDPVSGWGDKVVEFNEDTGVVIRDRWVWLSLTTFLMQFAMFSLLLMSARFVGITTGQVGAAELFATYVFSQLIVMIPITPGGLGVVQLGVTGALVAAGADNDTAAAATLVYTALTWLPPIPTGVICFVGWKRWRSKQQHADAMSEPTPVEA